MGGGEKAFVQRRAIPPLQRTSRAPMRNGVLLPVAPRARALQPPREVPPVRARRLGGVRRGQGGVPHVRAVPPVQGRRGLRGVCGQRLPGVRDHGVLDPGAQFPAGVHRHRHAHPDHRPVADAQALDRGRPRRALAAHAHLLRHRALVHRAGDPARHG